MSIVLNRRLICLFSASLLFVAGCPATNNLGDIQVPPASAFAIPEDAVASRISNGQAAIYVVPDDMSFTYRFVIAAPDEPVADHVTVGIVDAGNFGFEEGRMLPRPNTVSFSNDLNRGVIGFDDGSFLLMADDSTGQTVRDFEVIPFGDPATPVFNPTIDPRGERVAFETASGTVGVSTLGNRGDIVGNTLLLPGRNPIFGTRGRLGFSDPELREFFVFDLDQRRADRFDASTLGLQSGPFGFGSTAFSDPFGAMDVGAAPGVIEEPGTFVEVSPFAFDPQNDDPFDDPLDDDPFVNPFEDVDDPLGDDLDDGIGGGDIIDDPDQIP